MIRIGILGCAEIAFRRFLPALMENKEFECVCIAEEYDKSKLEQFEKEFGIKSAENFQAIIEDEYSVATGVAFSLCKSSIRTWKTCICGKTVYDQL